MTVLWVSIGFVVFLITDAFLLRIATKPEPRIVTPSFWKSLAIVLAAHASVGLIWLAFGLFVGWGAGAALSIVAGLYVVPSLTGGLITDSESSEPIGFRRGLSVVLTAATIGLVVVGVPLGLLSWVAWLFG